MRRSTLHRLAATLTLALTLGVPLGAMAADGKVRTPAAERFRTWLLGKQWVQSRIDRAIETKVFDVSDPGGGMVRYFLSGVVDRTFSLETGLKGNVLVAWSPKRIRSTAFAEPGTTKKMHYRVTTGRLSIGDAIGAVFGFAPRSLVMTRDLATEQAVEAIAQILAPGLRALAAQAQAQGTGPR